MNSEKLIQKHEGFKNKPYRDTEGILTVGYGRNLEKGLSGYIINEMFQEDMEDVRSDCLKFNWYIKLTPARQAVIENMIFNLGFTRFSKFTNTIKAIEAKDYKTAAFEMLDSKWSDQVGARAQELATMMINDRFKE